MKVDSRFAWWRRFSLAAWSPVQWRAGSWVYQKVGMLQPWRAGSELFAYAEAIGAGLLAVSLLLGPFVSSSLIGISLLGGLGFWGLLTLAETELAIATPIHVLAFLYWLVASIALALSPVRGAAFSGWVELTLYLGIFVLAARVLRSRPITDFLVSVLLLVSIAVSTYGVRQQFFGARQLATWNDPTSVLAQDTRVYSFLDNPNLLAGYLMFGVAFSLAAILVWRRLLPRMLAVLMFGCNTACLYFTDSRGGWLGLLAIFGVFLLLLRYWWHRYLPHFWQKWLIPLALGLLAAGIVGAIVVLEPIRLRVMSMFAGREDSSNNFRINVWIAVIKMIRDRPLLGIGPGNDAFNVVYPLYMQPRYTALSAYSIYLEILVELGFLGLGIFLWLVSVTVGGSIWALKKLRTADDLHGFWVMAALAAIAGTLVQGFFDTVWYRPQINTLWWFAFGLLASRWPLISETETLKS
ncbi:MAG: IctB family putative bicarbonate transporter [Cyanobacteria bacterium P01_H01_bin.15]